MKISDNKSLHIFSKKPFRSGEEDLFNHHDTVQLNSHLQIKPEHQALDQLRSMAEKHNSASISRIIDNDKVTLKTSPLYMTFIGAPGSGKGTHGRQLAKKYNIPHISAGKLLREIASKETPLAEQVKPYIEHGELVPDDLINAVIEERLKKPDCEKGFILDGFPRTGESAVELDRILARQGKQLGNVIELKISREECLNRLTKRGRHDDKPDIINHRYDIFLEEAQKIRDNFETRENLYRGISTEHPVETVQNGLVDLVDEQLLKVKLNNISLEK